MAVKLYSLKLTDQELWILSEGYAASFTDPASRNPVELRVSEKLKAAVSKMHRDKTTSKAST